MTTIIDDNKKELLSTSTSSVRTPILEKERDVWLAEFERTWKAPRLLRPKHKAAIKQYYSIKQGRDGTRTICYFCGMEFANGQLQIHHIDHNRTNNQLSNVPPACESCNNDERKEWLAASYAKRAPVITLLKKENETDPESIQKALSERLLKEAPTTFQKSKQYKHRTLVYLLQNVKFPKLFDVAIADVVAITGCSYSKAIEYLNGFSQSFYAPFDQWFDEGTQYIGPRKGWDEGKYATEEYRAAKRELEAA